MKRIIRTHNLSSTSRLDLIKWKDEDDTVWLRLQSGDSQTQVPLTRAVLRDLGKQMLDAANVLVKPNPSGDPK